MGCGSEICILIQGYKVDELPSNVVKLLDEEGASTRSHEVHFDYDFWTAGQSSSLPPSCSS